MLRGAFFQRFFLRSFEWFALSPLCFAFIFLFLYLFVFHFYFSPFCLYLPFLQVADRSKVAIGIYPRGCVDRLLWFIISFISFCLVPYKVYYDFVLSPIGSNRSFSLLLAIFGDGRSRPRSLSMVPAPPRGLHRLYLNPQHNWLYWVKWQWLFCPTST